MMKNTVHVQGIRLYAYHGCLPEEAVIGGHYVVHVSLVTDFREAAKTDDLTKTIDYVQVNRIVAEEMAIRSKLIEEVGYRIVKRCREAFKTLEKITVQIEKLSPPINGDVESVSILIED